MLTCLRTRRRIGAYLDGALREAAAASAERHLAACLACRQEAEALRRMKTLLRRTLAPASVPAEPDWTGFWPGIVSRLEDARREPAAPRRPLWLQPRWALGGALVAGLLVYAMLWPASEVSLAPEAPVIVSSADTDHPGGSVMVYHTPERDMTVVWVFGLDD